QRGSDKMKHTHKKDDLRIRRTYKLLSESLLDLLSENKFEDISVTDICEKAMIHRTTFYKHFEDKYQLLKFCVKEFQINFSKENNFDYKFNNLTDYYINTMKNILEFITSPKNKSQFVALLKNNRNSIQTIFHETIVEDVILKLEDVKKNGNEFSVPIPMIAEFYAGAIISVIRWWFESDMTISVEDLIRYSTFLSQKNLFISN
ncbi:TetR/AcrR family transcriptional regulator C-terminal domain-containing protein, partial [Clostridium neonatale]